MTGKDYGAAEGSHGQVVISGNTSLGNIYAGSISRDSKNNRFDKPATITIEDGATGKMGSVYASGALETPDESNWFDLDQIVPPVASVEKFPVADRVTIRLYKTVVNIVDGKTGGSRNADIEFAGDQNNISTLLLKNISGLSMVSGDLKPAAGSSFGDGAGAVSVPVNTKLDLSNFGDSAAIGSFAGGGSLVLGQSQTLTISGAVTGNTTFGAGMIFGGESGLLIPEHPYIIALQSDENSFTLAQVPGKQPTVELKYDNTDGSWTGVKSEAAGDQDQVIVEGLGMSGSVVLPSDSTSTIIPLEPVFAANSAWPSYMDSIPLVITVNNEKAVRTEDEYGYYTYTAQGLKLEVIEDDLCVSAPGSGDAIIPLEDGRYEITVSVPAEYTAEKQPIQGTVVLTVGDAAPVISTIAIESTDHKTSYLTGEALDVSGLTLLVTMSDGSTRTVEVTADMVSGFDSSAPAESQTLTVSYEGKTAVYTVSIAAPAPKLYTVAVNGSYAVDTGAGSYAEGSTVRISAGVRDGYTFNGWSATGVTLSAPGSADTSFTMPANDVTVTASWQAESGGSGTGGGNTGGGNTGGSSGGSSGGSGETPSLPVSTSGTGGSKETTAAPEAVISGGTAAASVSEEMAAEIARQAADSGRVVIAPVISGKVTKTEVSLPAAAMKAISGGTNAKLVVSTPTAKVSISQAGVKELAQSGGAVTVAAQCQGSTAELSVTAGGRPVSGLAGGVTMEVPYSDCKPGIVAVRVNADGSRQVVRKSFASAEAGTVSIPLDGSARLEIVDKSRTFADMPAAKWASTAVVFASSHELFNGTSATRFSPNAPMTRGMLATVLHNLENNPDYTAGTSFDDVSSGAWFEDAVYWAAEKGIVSGYGNGSFGARDNVTREQLAAMLYRYAGSPEVSGSLDGFTDSGKASDYALSALRWATEQGIIAGKGGGILDPAGRATRAETAAMLMRFCEKIK